MKKLKLCLCASIMSFFITATTYAAMPLTVFVEDNSGNILEYVTYERDIDHFLSENGISLSQEEFVTFDEDKLYDQATVKILKKEPTQVAQEEEITKEASEVAERPEIEKEMTEVLISIPFETEVEYNFEEEVGVEKVIQEGSEGEKKEVIEKTKENGKEIHVASLKVEVVKEPEPKIIQKGSKEVVEEKIEKEIIYVEDDTLEEGTEVVDSEGKDGVLQKTYKVEEERELVSEEVIEKPVDTIILVGSAPSPPTEETENTTTSTTRALDLLDSESLYSISDFEYRGVIRWNNYKFTYYSERVLPGKGLKIPGRHIQDGFVTDEDGYIVLAATKGRKGEIFGTPFGRPGKVYDTCASCDASWLDVYTR